METHKFFIIGGGKLQVDFIKAVKKLGFLSHVFDYDPVCEGAKIADKFYCVSIDAMEDILEIAKKENPIAIHTVATEAGNVTACYVGEKLGLNTNSYETALNTTDKSRMKRLFVTHDIPNAKVYQLSSAEDLSKIDISYPIVIKPADRSAGRGVSKVHHMEELKKAYAEAYIESNNKIVLAEEYLQGRQYSVETLSQNGSHHVLTITEEYLADEDLFVESQHLVPARVDQETQREVEALIIKILNAFEIKFGASHIELRITPDSIKIIEIASRMGGYRDILIQNSYGIDYNDLIVKSVTGQSIDKIIDNSQVKNYTLVKVILDHDEFQVFNHIKENYPHLIIKENIYFRDKEKVSRNLAESQGYYYLSLNLEEVDKFINMRNYEYC